MKTIFKRLTSLLLVICMCVTLLPLMANEAEAAITVFLQGDSRWGSHQYGYSNSAGTTPATIKSGGCGILSYVNAVYYLNGNFIQPIELADYSVKYGYRINGVGTSYGLYKSFADNRGNNYGIKYIGVVETYAELKSKLQQGMVAICGKPGHIMACVDYDVSTQKYLILDSAPNSKRGTSSGYAWKTQSQMQAIEIRTIFYIIASTSGHTCSYSSKVTSPTCTAQGYTTYTCSGCGNSYTGNTTSALGHSYKYYVNLSPTISATGELYRECLRCTSLARLILPQLNTSDYTYTVVSAATHASSGIGRYTWNNTAYGTYYFDVTIKHTCSYSSKVTSPTCTAEGYTKYTCSECGYSYTGNTTSALGHSYKYYVNTVPTISASGELYRDCSRCSSMAKLTLPKLNSSDYNYSVISSPTYTSTGTGRYTWKNTSYGTYRFDVTIPKLEPQFVNTISCWVGGLVNGEGTNSAQNMVCLDVVEYPINYGDPFTLKALNGLLKIPNGFYLDERCGTSSIKQGTWEYYKIGDTISQPNNSANFEYYYYPITYKITYNLDGGVNNKSNPSTYNVLYGVTFKSPTKEGYIFDGWLDESGNKITGINEGKNADFVKTAKYMSFLSATNLRTVGDRIITAKWVKKQYSIVYNANGGSGAPSSQTKTHGVNLTLSSTKPTRSGYTFLGWSTSSTATSATYQPGSSYSNNSNVTLYAVWKTGCEGGNHSYDYSISKTPTQSTTGTLIGSCLRCSHGITVVLPKLSTSDYYYDIIKNSTCTQNGVCSYTWKKSTYGSYSFEDIIPMKDHSYNSKVTSPTCTEKGYTTHICVCGDNYVDTYVNANGHSFGEWIVTIPATENSTGIRETTCYVCSYKETESIPRLDHIHDYSIEITTPKCTEAGFTTYTCVCGDSYVSDYVSANGHTEVVDKAVSPTCSEPGKTEGKYCSVCGTVTVKQSVIPALGDGHKYTDAVDQSCNVCGQNRKITYTGWLLHGSDWYYYENGFMLKSCWKKDSIGWVYLGTNGAMLRNAWCTDSKGWCYVGNDGYAVTNCWKKDSTGWIWLDANGSMTKNKWIMSEGNWYYLDSNGYMAKNMWCRDSKGWVFLGTNGAMLRNAWCTDSKGWCYVGNDGYAVTNCWKKDSIGWIWLDANGSMTKDAWVKYDGVWYYLDINGYMA